MTPDPAETILPPDTYDLAGQGIPVQSNTQEVLDHVRSIYGRFHRSGKGVRPLSVRGSDPFSAGSTADAHPVTILDHLDTTGELLVEDGFHAYRMVKTDAISQFTCQNLETLEIEMVGFCDPATLIQTSLLRTASLLAKDRHLLHAGAASRNGRAFLFPADPGHGKTSLVLTLVRRGWRFLSDEVACLRDDGAMASASPIPAPPERPETVVGRSARWAEVSRPPLGVVEPFPRSLIIREDARDLLDLPPAGESAVPGRYMTGQPRRVVDIEQIVPDCLGEACPLTHVLFLHGFGETPRLEPLAGANALFQFLPLSISPIGDAGESVYRFAPLFDRVTCYNLVLGEPDETADLLAALADGELD